MEIDKEKLDELDEELFRAKILSYKYDLIVHFEKFMDVLYKGFKKTFERAEPTDENDITTYSEAMQRVLEENFNVTDHLKEIFENFHYAVDNDKIYFRSSCILDIFSHYLAYEKKLEFEKGDEVFDFLFYFHYFGESEYKETAKEILIEFVLNLLYFILYRDYPKLVHIFNPDFVVSPNDNHIPIRIALLNALNLINDLNNTVPNKENIYRIVHAIVGGNQDNVKKYCLSLIGKNSLSQKQITKKHIEFAQKYINEKKL